MIGVPGTAVSHRTAYEVLRDFRDDLGMCGIKDYARFTLKAFRAGCATDLAASGSSLPSILEAGEWRSSALLKYISETEIDKFQFVRRELENEDSE